MGILSGIFGKKKEEAESAPPVEETRVEPQQEQETFQQDREEEAPDFHKLIWLQLLFREKPERPEPELFAHKLGEKLGCDIDTVTQQSDGLYSFAAKGLLVEYKDDAKVPAQVLTAPPSPFDPGSVDDFLRGQLWDVQDGAELLDSCKYMVMCSDFMASGLTYLERARLLTAWLETALELYPTCDAVWTPSAGKLLTRKQALENPLEGDSRFLWYGVNVRFFNISDGQEGEKVMDTLGLYALGLPDVQIHFLELDPNPMANYLYNVGQYLYDNDVPIKPGETVDGVNAQGQIDRGIQWECWYEKALIQPERPVMDICPGRFAAGCRERRDGSGKGKNKK